MNSSNMGQMVTSGFVCLKVYAFEILNKWLGHI